MDIRGSSGVRVGLLFLLKLLLTAGCLIWALSEVDFRATILSRPQDLQYSWVALGLVSAGLTVVLTALRFQLFLIAQNIHVSFRRLIELTLIGNFCSLASIGSIGGDAVRIILLSKMVPERKLAITTAVLMDHLCGMVGMAILFFLFTIGRYDAIEEQSTLGKGVLQFTWVYLGGGTLLLGAGFFIMSPLVHGRVHRGGRWIRWKFMQTFPEAWDRYRTRWKHALAGLGVSVVMLVSFYLSFWAGARAVGCEVSAGTMIGAMPIIDGISSIPVSVSGIGVREKLFEVVLSDLAGIPGALAVSASLVGFLLQITWALLGAVIFLRYRSEVTVQGLRESQK